MTTFIFNYFLIGYINVVRNRNYIFDLSQRKIKESLDLKSRTAIGWVIVIIFFALIIFWPFIDPDDPTEYA